MHNSDLGVVHFVSPAGGLLNAQGAQGRPLHISPATFLCIFPGYRYFETAPSLKSNILLCLESKGFEFLSAIHLSLMKHLLQFDLFQYDFSVWKRMKKSD